MGLIVLASLDKYLRSARPIDIPLRFQSDKAQILDFDFQSICRNECDMSRATHIDSRPVRWLTEMKVIFIGERSTDWPVRLLNDLVSSFL